jgi:chromosome segregation ATPase
MARAKDRPAKTALDTLQDWLSGGGQALLDGAQTVQRVVLATGRTVEEQLGMVVSALEHTLRERIDQLVSGIAVSLRSEVEAVREEVQELREQFDEPPAESTAEQIFEPLRALANGALERAAYAQTRLTELTQRLERVESQEEPTVQHTDLERRLTSLETRFAASTEVLDEAARQRSRDQTRSDQVAQLEQRVREIRVELGEKAADLPSMRERLAKIEARVLETSKEQIARAGESTSLRDRLARLEARLTDLSREQVARAVEAAGLRERVFRLEQRAGSYVQNPIEPPVEGDHPTG